MYKVASTVEGTVASEAIQPYACFVGGDLGCSKLLKLHCSDEKAKYYLYSVNS